MQGTQLRYAQHALHVFLPSYASYYIACFGVLVMRLHPAPTFKGDYIFYASRVEAMSNTKINPEVFYTTEDGWTEESQKVFKFLCTVKGNKLPFRIIKWKGLKQGETPHE